MGGANLYGPFGGVEAILPVSLTEAHKARGILDVLDIIVDIFRYLFDIFRYFFDICGGLEAPQYPKNHGARHSSVFPKFQHRDFYGDPKCCDFYK